MKSTVLQGNNVDVLKTFPDNHFDSIVTDPPYGIDFLGKAWDANTGALETYQECLRVLKPGGHILAFSAARTYHHLAVTIEAAGFEIRDQIMWIYSSGFPKSQDVGRQLHKKTNGKPDKQRFDPSIMIKLDGDRYQHPNNNKLYRALPDINGDKLAKSHEGLGYGVVYEEIIEVDNAWSGWGTQLKPAHEPIVLARKPLSEKNIAANCEKYGTGAINIDATRVEREGEDARFPSNVLGEISDYQKYFYCPKVSRRERHVGFDELPEPMFGNVQGAYGPDGNRMAVGFDNRDIATEASMLEDMGGYYVDDNNNETKVTGKNIWLPQTGRIYIHGLKEEYRKWCEANGKTPNVGNNHPTVKPIELMKYLIKLITPPGGKILDPFNGSGSTGCAAVELDYDYTGIELDEKYVAIAEKRIAAWYQHTHNSSFTKVFEIDA